MSSALLARPRNTMARAIQDRIAGSDFHAVHSKIWDTAGERWFSENDAIWRVHADTSMFIGGIRALLLQSLHPVAMWAISESSGFRGDPWGRLHRTSAFLAITTYGTIADAERSIAIVKAIHRRVNGTLADGRRYSAADPHLLRWIHVAELDSFLSAHQRFGRCPLSQSGADEYVAQCAIVAEKLGVVDAPRTVAELEAAIRDFQPELAGSEPALEAAQLLLWDPPLPPMARIGYEALAAGAVSLLPAWARAQLHLPTLPITDRLVAQPLARTMSWTIRWALAGGDTDTA
jgi:uncharacterized protein (DUF2236 family)